MVNCTHLEVRLYEDVLELAQLAVVQVPRGCPLGSSQRVLDLVRPLQGVGLWRSARRRYARRYSVVNL